MKRFPCHTKRLYLLLSLTLMLSLFSCIGYSTPNQSSSTQTTTPLKNTPAPENQLIDIQQICLSPQALPKSLEARLDGIVTIDTFSFDDPFYFFDLDTKDLYPIPFSPPNHRLWGGKISPYGESIAFEVDDLDNRSNVIESKLAILDAHGQQIETMIWEKQWGVIRRWLDNEHLFIDGWGSNLGKIFVVNPFTQQTEEVNPAFPNLYDDYPSAYWSVVPNSELTLALYPNMSSKDESIGFNLWTISNKEKLWHQDSRTAPSVIPRWSPDQTQFVVFVEESPAVGNQAEIIIIDNTGNLVTQTNFSSKYSYIFIGDEEGWSPDGRYLFFWLSAGSSENPPQRTSLAVLDLIEKTVTDLCVRSYGIGNRLTFVQGGKWLITRSDEARSNLLIDLQENKAYLFQIPVDGIVHGWMIKPNP